MKATILLEELVEAFPDFEYDAWLIPINGVQFTSGFQAANPNSKIPAMMDHSDPAKPVRVFESGSILLYLCDKFDKDGEVLPQGISCPCRVSKLVDVADGQRTIYWWRLWTFLPLCSGEVPRFQRKV